MDRAEFSRLMVQLKNIYPNFKINDKDIQAIWWSRFESLKYNYCKIAVDDYIGTEKFSPTPADILTRYREVEERNHNRYMDLLNDYTILHEYFPLEFRGENDKKIFLSAIKSETYDECKAKARSLKKYCYEVCMMNKPEKNFKGVVSEWMQNSAL